MSALARNRKSFQRLYKADEHFAAAWDRAVGREDDVDEEQFDAFDAFWQPTDSPYWRPQIEAKPAPEPRPAIPGPSSAELAQAGLEQLLREREEAELAEAERQRLARNEYERRKREIWRDMNRPPGPVIGGE